MFSLERLLMGEDLKELKGIKLMTIEKAHENMITAVDMLTPNLFITGSSDGIVRIWDIIEKKYIS